MHRAGGAVEPGVAEREHAAVGGNEPVALARRRRVHADDRCLQPADGCAVAGCLPEAEHRGAVEVQARRVVQRGLVRGRARGRARRVELPRRHAGDHAAHDRAEARDVLMTLAVAELRAARVALVAGARRAVARARVATGIADATAASARAAGGVAVDVVARAAVAERGVVGLPPSGRDRSRRAGVGAAVHRAAHRGPSRIATRGRPAERGVRGAGAQEIAQRVDRERGADDRGLRQEAAARAALADALRDAGDGALRETRRHGWISRFSSARLTSAATCGR